MSTLSVRQHVRPVASNSLGRAPAAGSRGSSIVEFRLLGPLEVLDDRTPVALGPHKQRAVLALLLLTPNRVVPVDRLVDQLWDGDPPGSALGTLQSYISNLRRLLEPGTDARSASVLRTQPPGYCMTVEPGALDVDRFATLAAQGRSALAAGDSGTARRLLQSALDQWRGPALADFAFEQFAAAEAAQLEELRIAAFEDRLEADLALGEHRQVVAALATLVSEHPLRERLRSQLMLALYRSGRQADALRVFQDGRVVLAEELGLDPGPELQRLETAILQQDPTLDHIPSPSATAGPLRSSTVASTNRPIRVSIADDNLLVRQGLVTLLQDRIGMHVVGVHGDPDELLAAIDVEAPDVVVTDIRMPPTGTDEGIRLAAGLRDTHPDVGVVVLSQHDDADYAIALLGEGSAGRAYLLKERVSDPGQLGSAVEEVARGGSVIDPRIVEGLVAYRSRPAGSPFARLSSREREVLAEMAEGRTNAAIGARLSLSAGSIEKHVNSLFSKLDLSEEIDVNRRVKAVLLFLAEQD